MLKIPLLLLFLLCFSQTMASDTDADQDDRLALLPPGAEASLLVVDPENGRTIYHHDADRLRPPASVQKLVTALSARLHLGSDYRFVTDLELKGNDVIFRFSGDPSLKRDDIRKLVEKLHRETAIIRGNIYLNGAVFDAFELAEGLPWDNLGVCYSAPSSSITLDDNCAVAKMLFADNKTHQLDFQISRNAPINIVDKLELTEGLEKRYCKFKLMADHDNRYTLGGCVGRHEIPRFLSFAIQNTTLYVADIIKRELEHAGIELQGKIVRNDQISGRLIARHQSAPLPDLLDEMLKESDNLIADNLLKTIGHVYFDEPGSFDNGVAAVKAVLKEKAGIDLGNAALVDGSGLSRNNRMTARQIMTVLQYIYAHPELKLLDAMAEVGKSGTLRYRPSLRDERFKGKVKGKTGTLYGTYNIAGVITTASGRPLLFVQMVTNYHHPEHHRHEKREIRAFEKKFYQWLYSME